MPYIKQDRRNIIIGDYGVGDVPANAGELNFQLTIAVTDYLLTHGLKYSTCNDIVGALEGAKAEFQRRVVAPYETKKCLENGDVYPSVDFLLTLEKAK